MQLPTRLGHIVRFGEVTLFTGDVKALQMKTEDDKIELKIADKEFLKDALDSVGSDSSISSKLAQLKSITVELKDVGLTVTLSLWGDRLVTMRLEAKPKFSRLVTRTDAMEINNLRKLIELGV